MVVKNVSGYDMPRLYLGSLGTLGIIVSANFKVLPRPRAESTIIAGFASSQDAFAAADRLRQSMEPVAALEVALLDRRWIMATRIEGRDATVDAVASRIAPVLPSDDMVRLDSGPSAEWWHTYVAHQAAVPNDNAVLIRCGVRPKVASGFVSGMVAALSDVGISAQYLAVSPGLGSVVARLDLGGNESPERLAEAQAVLLGLADTVTILAAPPYWKRGIDVWGRLPEGFDVMRSLRQQFDPQRTINPGRFAGFL
jgi:glycolate oxidase FAD binding subunit